MEVPKFKRLPRHIAVIPDGNRRWAQDKGLEKYEGYKHGIEPGVDVYDLCVSLGIEEFTFFGFTQDNTKRPKVQVEAFSKACIDAVEKLSKKDAELLVVGDSDSNMFPKELLPYTQRTKFGNGKVKVNFLVNYGWYWDLNYGYKNSTDKDNFLENIASHEIPRIDLVIRWGGRRRLSGILPVQSVYSDIYVIDDMWPDFKHEHIFEALEWYQNQDITLGG
ncbi:MAG: polyprenyl diphosphate synthase [Clostridia bacterium]|nr:polyprenyl diphosphate synthase [Clostridia bacterium]